MVYIVSACSARSLPFNTVARCSVSSTRRSRSYYMALREHGAADNVAFFPEGLHTILLQATPPHSMCAHQQYLGKGSSIINHLKRIQWNTKRLVKIRTLFLPWTHFFTFNIYFIVLTSLHIFFPWKRMIPWNSADFQHPVWYQLSPIRFEQFCYDGRVPFDTSPD